MLIFLVWFILSVKLLCLAQIIRVFFKSLFSFNYCLSGRNLLFNDVDCELHNLYNSLNTGDMKWNKCIILLNPAKNIFRNRAFIKNFEMFSEVKKSPVFSNTSHFPQGIKDLPPWWAVDCERFCVQISESFL